MQNKRPYTHILKNLFHEQAEEIVPLLMPRFRIEEIFEVELPDLESTPRATQPSEVEKGLVGLILPGATVVESYDTKWIEHSGQFERAYRVQDSESDRSCYLVTQFQTDHETRELPFDLLQTMLQVEMNREDATDPPVIYDNDDDDEDSLLDVLRELGDNDEGDKGDAQKDEKHPAEDKDEKEQKPRGTHVTSYIYPVIIWEKDAREFLNSHISAIYFLLPCMKNADATLLKLAIEELAQHFQGNDLELGRHLTGLNLLLQMSETMAEEEKQAAQIHLQRFAHLIKHDPTDNDLDA